MTATPFFGPAYISRSKNLADCQLINLFPEVVETKQGRSIGALFLTPGLRLLATVGDGPIRGLHVSTIPKDPTLYVVSGTRLYRVDTAYAITDLGSVAAPLSTLTTPISFTDNGQQIAVFNGARGFVLTDRPDGTPGHHGSLAPITLPFGAGPIMTAYMDGFAAINQAGTAKWWQSDLLDLTTWDALNFASADTNPDNLVTLAQVRREMFLFKELGIEVWDNAGTPGFVFARATGVLIEHGIVSAKSLVKAEESLFWLSRSNQGVGTAFEMTGYNPKRISTFGLEYEWQHYPTLADATAFAYQQSGHRFYVLNFPSGDATWVYDITVSNLLGIPCWHRRAVLDPVSGEWRRHWAGTYASFNSIPVVGDYRNANLYVFDFAAQLDWQAQRAWLRSWPAGVGDKVVRFPALTIQMQTGIGVPDATDPQVSLKWSDDGGHSWSNGQIAKAGGLGETAQRVRFPRIGSTRRNSGLYRIFELSSGDVFPAALIGAEFEE